VMKWERTTTRARSVLLSEPVGWLLPTPAAYYMNRCRVRDPVQLPVLPVADWSQRERRQLLVSSEERLRNIEGKGPGLATVSAIIAGAVLLALTGGWHESTLLARILLGIASFYAVWSLALPLFLVGPLVRDGVHVAELEAAASSGEPEEVLATSAAQAAMRNDLRNLRLVNLLDAARRELAYAFVLLLVWALLVPVSGALRRESTTRPPAVTIRVVATA
jgi:hypothetical protein